MCLPRSLISHRRVLKRTTSLACPLKLLHQRNLAVVEVAVVEGTSGQAPRRLQTAKQPFPSSGKRLRPPPPLLSEPPKTYMPSAASLQAALWPFRAVGAEPPGSCSNHLLTLSAWRQEGTAWRSGGRFGFCLRQSQEHLRPQWGRGRKLTNHVKLPFRIT